jgi:hypothetical protein
MMIKTLGEGTDSKAFVPALWSRGLVKDKPERQLPILALDRSSLEILKQLTASEEIVFWGTLKLSILVLIPVIYQNTIIIIIINN